MQRCHQLNDKMWLTLMGAAQQGADVLRKYYGQSLRVQYKTQTQDAGSVVSQADFESQTEIIKKIRTVYPFDGIFSEEGVDERMNSLHQWYIDPLDGTANFIRNIPLWGISIGYVFNGVPMAGILYFPYAGVDGTPWYLIAMKGKGVQGCMSPHFKEESIHVSDRTLEKSLYYAGGNFKGKQQIETSVSQRCGLTKIIDASSFELAQIAAGDAELYILKSVPHDVAAGVVIVQEAGGKVTDAYGKPWTLQSDKIVVSNGVIHDEVIDILKAHGGGV